MASPREVDVKKPQRRDRTAERGRFSARWKEVLRLKAMVGELMMKTELLAERARLLEGSAPGLPWRKSRG